MLSLGSIWQENIKGHHNSVTWELKLYIDTRWMWSWNGKANFERNHSPTKPVTNAGFYLTTVCSFSAGIIFDIPHSSQKCCSNAWNEKCITSYNQIFNFSFIIIISYMMILHKTSVYDPSKTLTMRLCRSCSFVILFFFKPPELYWVIQTCAGGNTMFIRMWIYFTSSDYSFLPSGIVTRTFALLLLRPWLSMLKAPPPAIFAPFWPMLNNVSFADGTPWQMAEMANRSLFSILLTGLRKHSKISSWPYFSFHS